MFLPRDWQQMLRREKKNHLAKIDVASFDTEIIKARIWNATFFFVVKLKS